MTFTTEAKNHLGERSFQTYAAWKRACRAFNPKVYFDGDNDIAQAMVEVGGTGGQHRSIGEWDGAEGVIYSHAVREDKEDVLSLPRLDAFLAGTLIESDELKKVAAEGDDHSKRRTADKLEIGDVVEITGNVNFKEQTGEITRFGKDKHFVVVRLYNGGEHSFHSSDVSEADLSHEAHEEEDSDANKFYVAFYDNAEERSWIGVISKEHGGKWHEKSFKGKPELRWGQTYMSYLTPDDIMNWIHKDYHRGIEIEGPFFDAHEAEEHVKQNWGRIDEAVKAKTPWAVLNSIAKDHGKTGFATLNSQDAARYVNMKKAAKIAEDEEGEFGLMTCDEAAMKRIINKNPDLLIGDAKKMFKAQVAEAKDPPKGEKISLMQAFGSSELAALEKAGIHLIEKPSYWEDLNKRHAVDELKLKRIENIIGHKLKEYEGWEIYPTMHDDDMPKHPQSSVAKMPKEDMFIVSFGDGSERYLCDRTGAKSYIRFWAKILPGVNEETFTNYSDWKQSVLLSHPTQAKNIKFRGKMEGEKTTISAIVPGQDAIYGIWDDAIEAGKVLSEAKKEFSIKALLAAFEKHGASANYEVSEETENSAKLDVSTSRGDGTLKITVSPGTTYAHIIADISMRRKGKSSLKFKTTDSLQNIVDQIDDEIDGLVHN